MVCIVLSSISCICASDIENVTVSDNTMFNQQVVAVDSIADSQLNISCDNSISSDGYLNDIIKQNHDDDWEAFMIDKALIIDKFRDERSNFLESEMNNSDLNDLQELIKQTPAGSTLNLYNDYNTIDNKLIIQINKDIIIDGNGHTIDLTGSSKHDHYFKVTDATVTFKNIRFINGYNKDDDKGGAIYFKGNAIGNIINCTFENCWAESSGGAIYSENKLNIYNSTFKGNTAAKGKGGAIFSKENIILFNSIFINNHAKEDGGAVYTNGKIDIEHSTFDSNTATGKSGFQNYGGAVCSKNDVTIYNSTFSYNKADDYAGAVYSYKSITINGSDDTKTIFIGNCAADNNGGSMYAKGNIYVQNAIFIGNCAADNNGGSMYAEGNIYIQNAIFFNNTAKDDGGAVYSEGDLNAVDTEFFQNRAKVDGGAIFSRKNVYINRCIFESNQATKPSGKCHGGAIRSKNEVTVDNCTFKNNFADKYGGAIYAESMKIIGNPSYFIENVINNGAGGAIYVGKFTCDTIKYATFRDNEAFSGSSDGGAIYIDDKCTVTFEQCAFISNHCGDDGGAIFLDSSDSKLSLLNTLFIGNEAESEGDTVFTKGTYGTIKDNFWGGVNPTRENNQLIEWMVLFIPNWHECADAPLKLQLTVSVEYENGKPIIKAEAIFCQEDGSVFSGELYEADLLSFIVIPNMKIIKEEKSLNRLYGEFMPLMSGNYTIMVKCYDFYTYVELSV